MTHVPVPDVGTEFAGYRIERELGRGGMGVVFLAEDERLRRKVALKLLPSELAEDPEFRARFDRESQMAAALEHPHIVPVYAAGEADGVLYIAMRYVRGTDLKQLIQSEGPLPVARALALLEPVADALDHAHQQGLVHRDVKPQNILVGSGGSSRAKECGYLTDFGLTKARGSKTLTRKGTLVGTLDYMSPEQLRAEELDPATDVYSFGAVLYECLTGVVAFDRPTDTATILAHLNDPPPTVTELRGDLDPPIDAVVARALAKERGERYATCGDLMEDLRVALGARGEVTVVERGAGDAAGELVENQKSIPDFDAGRAVGVPLVDPVAFPPAAAPVPEHKEGRSRVRKVPWGVLAVLLLVAGSAAAAVAFLRSGDEEAAVDDELQFSRVPPSEEIFGGASDQVMNRVAVTPQGFVGVGRDGPKREFDAAMWISADGASWRRVRAGPEVFGGEAEQQMYGVSPGGPGAVMVGYDSSGPDLDAAVWLFDGTSARRVRPDQPALGGEGNQVMTRVVEIEGTLVAVGFESIAGEKDALVWTSPTGSRWTRLETLDPAALGGPGDQFMRAVVGLGEELVGVGHDTSGGDFDAAAWLGLNDAIGRVPHDEESLGGEGDQDIRAVTLGPPGAVAVGIEDDEDRDPAVWVSADGETWERVARATFDADLDQALVGVVGTAEFVVAVGFDNAPQAAEGQNLPDFDAAVWVSADGRTWTRLKPDERIFGGAGAQQMSDVAAAGGVVVAVGADSSGGDSDAAVWISDLPD